MMGENTFIQDIEPAEAKELLAIAQDVKSSGYRLGQACATAVGDVLEILYTFEKNNKLKSYKIPIDAKEPEIQSVTAIYPYAFIYENEMHDLFGIKFKNLGLDYEGKFFKIAKEYPFNPALSEGGEN